VGKELKRQGYSLGDMPVEPEAIMDMVLNDKVQPRERETVNPRERL